MKFRFLTSDFYNDYSDCEQILVKDKRPYTFVLLELENNILVAVPLRSNIEHEFAIKTPKTNGGLDLSKSIIITDRKSDV